MMRAMPWQADGPLSIEGWRNAVRTSVLVHWASWGYCLDMIHDRHPEVAHIIVIALENHFSPNLEAAVNAKAAVTSVLCFSPDWRALVNELRPPPRELEEHEPGPRSKVRAIGISACGSRLLPRGLCSDRRVAQEWEWLSPLYFSNYHNRIESHLFRVLLQRRLRLHLRLSSCFCRYGRFFTPQAPSCRLFEDGKVCEACVALL